jgi:hypothetical protein
MVDRLLQLQPDTEPIQLVILIVLISLSHINQAPPRATLVRTKELTLENQAREQERAINKLLEESALLIVKVFFQ